MNHVQLETELLKAAKMLTKQIDEYRAHGQEFAATKREYAIALSKKLLELADAGRPATLSDQLAKGDEGVADARQRKDVAFVLWRAVAEHIHVLQTQVDIARSLLVWEREERFENPIPGGE